MCQLCSLLLAADTACGPSTLLASSDTLIAAAGVNSLRVLVGMLKQRSQQMAAGGEEESEYKGSSRQLAVRAVVSNADIRRSRADDAWQVLELTWRLPMLVYQCAVCASGPA